MSLSSFTNLPSMAAALSSIAVTLKPLNCSFSSSNSRLSHHPISAAVFPPSLRFNTFRRCKNITICFVIEDQKQSCPDILTTSRLEKEERKKSERFTYLIAAMMSSFGITSMAIMSVYYRFYWQMKVKKEHKSSSKCSIFSDRILKLRLGFCLDLGSWGTSIRNVWYICFLNWCRRKLNFCP